MTHTGKQNEPINKAQSFYCIVLYFTISTFLLLTYFSYTSCTSPTTQTTKENESPELKTQRINYQIYREWKIPNGGYGRVIVIEPNKRNEADLKLLGETIKYDTHDDRNAFVFVFDNGKAAEMRDRLSKLNKTDENFYGKHFIANYTRNINSGFHQLEIMVDGINGKWITVKY